MKAMLKEFKEFALKGNMVDLAIGVIIGGAFSGLVNSLVDNIIMPLISLVIGGIDISDWSITIPRWIGDGPNAEINYGFFLSELINFVIMAFVIFMMVKLMNKLRKPVEEEVTTKECPYCKSEIPLEATKCPHCTSDV
jgi:large conductance mechanosensitive channel